MESPVGYCEPEYPTQQPDFESPTVSVPLLLLASPVSMSFLVVAGRPAYDDGAVMQWTRFLADHFRLTLTSAEPGRVGGVTRWHPAIIARGSRVREGTTFRMLLAVLEDGGRLVTVHTMAPEEPAGSDLETLARCVFSFELTDPKGPTTPLVMGGTVPVMESIEHGPQPRMPRDAGDV